MTPEESLQCERQHQEYMQRREEFNKEVMSWFETNTARKNESTIERNNNKTLIT